MNSNNVITPQKIKKNKGKKIKKKQKITKKKQKIK